MTHSPYIAHMHVCIRALRVDSKFAHSSILRYRETQDVGRHCCAQNRPDGRNLSGGAVWGSARVSRT
jgi:hypothetical protein